MNLRRLLLAAIWTLGSVAFPNLVWSLPPPGYVPPPPPPPIAPAERFAQADQVIYGTIIRLDQDARTERFQATLEVERSWKGAPAGETVEIVGQVGYRGDCVITLQGAPLNFAHRYLVFLSKAKQDGIYQIDSIIRNFPYSSLSAFGGPFEPSRRPSDAELAELEIAEFLERKGGNTETADHLLADLNREHRLRAEEKERASLENQRRIQDEAKREVVKQDLQKALEETDPVRRKALLEKLLERLKEQDQAANELRQKIDGEISIVETAIKNGLKQAP